MNQETIKMLCRRKGEKNKGLGHIFEEGYEFDTGLLVHPPEDKPKARAKAKASAKLPPVQYPY